MIHTKIVATIGPASDTAEKIEQMYKSGMKIARLNFSHGNYEYFEKLIKTIRKVSPKIAILLDTKGPEIRSGKIENGEIELCDQDKLILTNKKILGTKKNLTINYKKLDKLKKNDLILIDDGLIECQVIKQTKLGTQVKILNGGKLGSNKTVSLKGHNPTLTFLSSKDKKDIKFGIDHNVDFIAASFVRTAKDVDSIKKMLNRKKSIIKIISKIEHWEAIKNLDEICKISDGIMVARGDLGVEIDMEQVPKIQKQLIKKCNQLGKPVIVATQMLESMKSNPRPTRAEISDVAQAILEGTDAIMLSGETAGGKYPIKSVQTMAKIAKEYEKEQNIDIFSIRNPFTTNAISEHVTRSAALASQELPKATIITPTESGYTARKISRFKPKTPIFAMTKNQTILRQLQLSWGVFPYLTTKNYKHVDEQVRDIISIADKNKLFKNFDKVIITSGHQMAKGKTNTTEIYNIKNIKKEISKAKH